MFDRILPVIRVKKLLLCILSLMLCLNTSVIHAKEPESLMIVAHPDDETIWGGSHLINGNYTVLCITNGNNKKRKKEFMNVMKKHIPKELFYLSQIKQKENETTGNLVKRIFKEKSKKKLIPKTGTKL